MIISGQSVAEAVRLYKNRPNRMHDIELSGAETGGEMVDAKNYADHLEKKYPGWLWGVTIEHGVVRIRAMRLHGGEGYTLIQSQIDNDYKALTRAGGEILERFGMRRGACNPSELTKLRYRHGFAVADKD